MNPSGAVDPSCVHTAGAAATVAATATATSRKRLIWSQARSKQNQCGKHGENISIHGASLPTDFISEQDARLPRQQLDVDQRKPFPESCTNRALEMQASRPPHQSGACR